MRHTTHQSKFEIKAKDVSVATWNSTSSTKIKRTTIFPPELKKYRSLSLAYDRQNGRHFKPKVNCAWDEISLDITREKTF